MVQARLPRAGLCLGLLLVVVFRPARLWWAAYYSLKT
jgi:hypothetical protein